jgi:DNA-binding Lrp family transcriptional regulator
MVVKVVGGETYINQRTGEIVETQTVIRGGDFDFHKIWLGHVLDAIDQVGNVKIKVLNHILRNMDGQNRYIGTISFIADEVGVSSRTVGELLRRLEDADFIVRIGSGVIRVNPKGLFKGGSNKRMNVLIKYREEAQKDMFEDAEENIRGVA